LAGRFHPDLARARIHPHPWGGFLRATALRHASPERFWNLALRQNAWFDQEVARALLREPGPFPFFSYTGTFLDSARAVRDRGGLRVLGQVDPARTEERIVDEERARWPGWEPESLRVPEAFHRRRLAEWEEADRIVVNSAWSRQALEEQGVPPSKLRVIPLVYESSGPSLPRSPRGDRLRVLWLGQVILRKGIAYLIEAARRLRPEPVDIRVIGAVSISPEAVRSAPPNLRFAGPVPRSEVGAAYAAADVFVLPTLSDGFALTQLEAMAHGLPVIATPCCGEVVTHGVNGFLVPPRDAVALAETIAVLAADPSRLDALSAAARATARSYTLDRLGRAWLSLGAPEP
jgi:glycosyltransferase involved in cell wall biosynthesis